MSNPTRWVGIDLHRRRSQIAIIDEHGELALSERIPTGRETIRELLGDPDGTHVALERPTAGSGSRNCSRTPALTCI
jgi:hypothetical protein